MDKDIIFIILLIGLCYLILRKDNKEHMTDSSFNTDILDKLSILNGSNKELINENKTYNDRITNIEKKTRQLTDSTSPNWGGWGDGITLNKAGHTTIYYPPGNMFIGLHGNRNLYIGNDKDGKYVLTLNTETGDLSVPGRITCHGLTTTNGISTA